MNQVDTDVRTQMLVRLGHMSGFMESLAEAMATLDVFPEWVEVLQAEAKKTDELVQIWSSM